jgi:hypothetical protein
VGAAEEAITQAGHSILDMKYFASSESPPSEVCRRAVTAADVYVGIIGFIYGSPVPDLPSKSYTELEFEIATRRGIPRLIYLLGEGTQGPRDLHLDEMYGARQNDFRQRLQEVGITTSLVETPHELQSNLLRALFELSSAVSERIQPLDEWAFIHAAMCRRIAAVMVDLMRLLIVRSSAIAHRSNNSRHEEFVRIAHDHYEDLRQNIASLPAIGDAPQYEKSREIELRILWLLRSLVVATASARVSPREFDVMKETMGLTIDYFVLYAGVTKETFDATVAALRAAQAPGGEYDTDADSLFLARQKFQTLAISMHDRDVGPGITMDVDNELAVRYFAVDCWLLGQSGP